MTVHIIAAVGSDLSIGRNGQLLRHISEDLRHFKALTLDSAIVMGRKTWESLPKRPLPKRLNIVVSRNPAFQADGALTATSLADAIALAENHGFDAVYIIGGGEIYRQALPLADVLDLTLVDADCPDADTFFPDFSAGWTLKDSSEGTPAYGQPPYRFATFVRSE